MKEERFADAARCRDEGLVGLQGWWVARTRDDPTGKVVHIRPAFGRYVGVAYTAKDVAEASGFTAERSLMSLLPDEPPAPLEESGVPVLEVFLREDGGGRVQNQAAALRVASPRENPDGSLSLGEVGESVMVESERDEEGNVLRMSVTFVKQKGVDGGEQVGLGGWDGGVEWQQRQLCFDRSFSAIDGIESDLLSVESSIRFDTLDRADIFISASKDTDVCVKLRWSQTSTCCNTGFRDHW